MAVDSTSAKVKVGYKLSELFKILKHRMYKLILLIWNKEQLPVEWLQGIICPIHKKGDRAICSKYRPIMLLNMAYKIFTILLNNRLSKIVDSKLSETQAGFRRIDKH